MRRFAEAAATEDRAIALAPEDAGLRTDRASLDLEWRADPKPLHKIFPAIFNENPAAAAEAGEYCLDLALCERDPVLAERALAAIGDGFNWNQLFFPVAFLKGCVARVFGDEAAARKAFTAARAEVERTVDERPDEGPPFCVLGLIDAGLGRNEEAIREGRRASELLPVSKDAMRRSLHHAISRRYLRVDRRERSRDRANRRDAPNPELAKLRRTTSASFLGSAARRSAF